MNKMTDIQKKVDEAMDSILHIGKAEPNPFFFTRLQARIRRVEGSSWEQMSRLITRPAFAVLAVSAVLILNLFVALNETSLPGTKPDLSEVATVDDLGANAFYAIENVQP